MARPRLVALLRAQKPPRVPPAPWASDEQQIPGVLSACGCTWFLMARGPGTRASPLPCRPPPPALGRLGGHLPLRSCRNWISASCFPRAGSSGVDGSSPPQVTAVKERAAQVLVPLLLWLVLEAEAGWSAQAVWAKLASWSAPAPPQSFGEKVSDQEKGGSDPATGRP